MVQKFTRTITSTEVTGETGKKINLPGDVGMKAATEAIGEKVVGLESVTKKYELSLEKFLEVATVVPEKTEE